MLAEAPPLVATSVVPAGQTAPEAKTEPEPQPAALPLHLITAAEYYAMLNAGIFGEDDRLELIEGKLVEMSPINPTHAWQVTRLMELLAEKLGKQAVFSPQNLVDLGLSQPQPDIAVLTPPASKYRRAHPKPSEVLWLVEVSDSTLTYDRTVKVLLYAQHGIREVWVVNLLQNCVEVYCDLTEKGYRTKHQYWAGDEFTSNLMPEVAFRVSDIFGD